MEFNQLLGPKGYVTIEPREQTQDDQPVTTVFMGPYGNVILETPKNFTATTKIPEESVKIQTVAKDSIKESGLTS